MGCFGDMDDDSGDTLFKTIASDIIRTTAGRKDK